MTFSISRFRGIEQHEYECEVVTPLFLGGADPKEAELRVPPIKAAMRFWWRALYDGGNVEQMAKEEADIFGSTEKKAVVAVKLDHLNVKPVLKDLPSGKKIMVTSKGNTFSISIVEYMAYGLFDPKQRTGRYIKKHIEPKSRFKLIVTFPNNVETDLVRAMKAMITFGGLGSRSRNGFGSLHCSDLFDQTFNKQGDLKSFTSFSKEAKLFGKFNTYASWEDALSEIGEVYRAARLTLEERHKFDKRGLIAMPIESKFEKSIPQHIKDGRHAKPYFLHVNKLDDKYQGQILFLPYQYKAGPNDATNRKTEYMDACGKMNEAITKGMGGAK
ncbi:MAG: type III-B CRISPR module RAMP protein Cmr1 [Syntrophales bacterium]|nr:type III-B CRISPR module RAMP protein Cmr1 [Syntrophales bacterium]